MKVVEEVENNESNEEYEEKISELTALYYSTEQKILEKTSKRKNNGKPCDCDEQSKFCIVEGDNILCYCLNCGGEILN